MSKSTTVFNPNAINRIRLNMNFVNVGNEIMQDQLMDEIKKIGFSSIEKYLKAQKNDFFHSQFKFNHFFPDEFTSMYPGGFDDFDFNNAVNPTTSIAKFDYTLCKKLFDYKWSQKNKLSNSNQKIIQELCNLRNWSSHETNIECDANQIKCLVEFIKTTHYEDYSILAKFEYNAYKLRPKEKPLIEKKIKKYLNDKITELIENDEELFKKV